MSNTYKESNNSAFSNIENLYSVYEPVIATKMVMDYYGTGMIEDIGSDVFRLMVWQVCHSLSYIEDSLSNQIDCMEEIEIIANEVQYGEVIRTCAKHLIGAIDSLLNYLDK
jgi:hypothetical protein